MAPVTSIKRGGGEWRRLSPLGLYRVAGDSMQPTYRPGDTLLGLRGPWLRWFRPRPGQVVVALHSGRPLIKRVAHLQPPAGPGQPPTVWLLGDNPAASTDSRHFGALSHRQLAALIIARLG